MNELDQLRNALTRIGDIAATVNGSKDRGDISQSDSDPLGVCTPKSLPIDLQIRAAKTARDLNPMNAPHIPFTTEHDVALSQFVTDPLRIALLTSKYWGPATRQLTVSFMEPTSSDLRNRIISHMNAWLCGIQFVLTGGVGQVRISRNPGGFWSYLGTDILHISTSRQTMNLEGFTMNTPESEFRRVIRHEAGHTLGFPHEHMRRQLVSRIDPKKACDFFLRTQGWSCEVTKQQVLTPLDDRSIIGTPPDETSSMCYQLPGEITRDGRPIIGGTDINASDRGFAQRVYPAPTGSPQESESGANSYSAREDEFVVEPALAG